MKITGTEYFLLGLKEGLGCDIEWYFDILTARIEGKESKYVTNNKGVVTAKLKDQEFIIDSLTPTKTVVDYKTKVVATSDNLRNITTPIETTIGRMIVNYVLLDFNFGSKIPYINENIKTGDIEKIIAKSLVNNEVTIEEYKSFVDSCTFLSTLSRIVTVVATPTNIRPPTGLSKFKEDLKEKYNKEYGKEWTEDKTKVGMFMEELKNFDKEYLKKDPTYKKVLTSKVVDNGRSKMFLAFGLDAGMTGKGVYVDNSLETGFPKDNDQLASIFDSSKLASYSRGHETQSGGVVAKIMLRVSNSLKIVKGDCGSTMFYPLEVTADNHKNLSGLYMQTGNSITLIEDTKSLVGKIIKIRSPIYCKAGPNTFCGTCCGKHLENRTTGLNLILTNISATILTSALKKMHNTQIHVGEFGLIDILK